MLRAVAMAHPSPEPVEVEYKSASKELRVSWSDGHQSLYGVRYLRGFCPCAQCQGHGAAWDYVANDGPQVTEIHEVGNYALNLVYEGGHRTGIYSFEILRNLCACDACRAQAGELHPWTRFPA